MNKTYQYFGKEWEIKPANGIPPHLWIKIQNLGKKMIEEAEKYDLPQPNVLFTDKTVPFLMDIVFDRQNADEYDWLSLDILTEIAPIIREYFSLLGNVTEFKEVLGDIKKKEHEVG